MLGLLVLLLFVALIVSVVNRAAWGVAPGGLLGLLLVIALVVLLVD